MINNDMNTEILRPILPIKHKRGRKSKKDLLVALNLESSNNIVGSDICETFLEMKEDVSNILKETETILEDSDIQPFVIENKGNIKKRGRKPKGGKIVQHLTPLMNDKESKPNVILHLKCSMKDLNNNQLLNNIESYNFASKGDLIYEIIDNNYSSINNNSSNNNSSNNNSNSNNLLVNKNSIDESEDEEDCNNNKESSTKIVWKKLKQLEHNLHINNISDKKSACFWCTYDFDNPPIYIPKFFIKNSYHVYGCFCSPECATSFLMEENIDSSTKFERYHFINHLYAKIYNYTKNIKPAPNPYYMLDKYYGNLSIQEYRSLFKNDRLFIIVDKPLTRMLPELHEDNDDFILNNKIIPSNNYQIKKKIAKKNQNKSIIMNEKFGIAS
jgi:hypothetical protein